MKPPCSVLLIAATLLAVAAPVALAGNGSDAAVYTWVDAHGIRHYSDQPGSPNARRLTFTSSGAALVKSEAQPPASAPAPSRHSSRTSPAAATTMSPAARAARCTKLRGEVERLQSVRRLRLHKNGTIHYLSGDNLVAFKKKMQHKMKVACASHVPS
ncbi:MAG: DUF4124 domain-containing protein [Gammaproteobacteria bacterium]